MTQEELEDIWARHLAGRLTPRPGEADAKTLADGTQVITIHKPEWINVRVWERKKTSDWKEI